MLKRITGIVLILAIALVFCNVALANDTKLPELKLSIKQFPPTAIPVMEYTAQLSFIPSNVYNSLVADYYNIIDSTKLVDLFSASEAKILNWGLLRKAQCPASPEQIREALNSMCFAEIEFEEEKYLVKTKATDLSKAILRALRISPPKNVLPANEFKIL